MPRYKLQYTSLILTQQMKVVLFFRLDFASIASNFGWYTKYFDGMVYRRFGVKILCPKLEILHSLVDRNSKYNRNSFSSP
jgi:hypothetical protein